MEAGALAARVDVDGIALMSSAGVDALVCVAGC